MYAKFYQPTSIGIDVRKIQINVFKRLLQLFLKEQCNNDDNNDDDDDHDGSDDVSSNGDFINTPLMHSSCFGYSLFLMLGLGTRGAQELFSQ